MQRVDHAKNYNCIKKLTKINKINRSQIYNNKFHFVNLDGVRGLAALTVFFHHAIFTSVDSDGWPSFLQPIIAISHFAQYGVDLFFALSGYLITSTLINNSCKNFYYREFYIKRATRIVPVYFIILFSLYLFMPGSGGYVVLSLLFIANFARWFGVDSVGPFWTLAIEEQFYLFWPFVVRTVSENRLRKISLGIIIIEPVLRFLDIATGRRYFVYTFFHCDGLAFGALLACQVRYLSSNDLSRKCILSLLGGLTLYAFFLSNIDHPIANAIFESLNYTAIGLIAYAIVGAAISKPNSGGVRWLGKPALVFFGQISYCLYMCHLYIFSLFDFFLGPLDRKNVTYILIRLISVLVVSTLICILSRNLIELPAIRLRGRLMRVPFYPNPI